MDEDQGTERRPEDDAASHVERPAKRRRPSPNRRAPTSKDVAARAGVSRTVVSFVLNNRPHTGIPEETRQRVLRAVDELGYRPNSAARSLASGRTRTLGVIVGESRDAAFSDAFLPELLRGITRAAQARGYRVMFDYVAEQDPGPFFPSSYFEGRVDGVLVGGPVSDRRLLEGLLEAGAIVMVIGNPGDVDCPSVDIDNVAAARSAVEHLIAHGYRRIGVLTNQTPSVASSRDRLQGYYDALANAGLSADESLVVTAQLTELTGRRAMEQLLAQAPTLDAVFIASDQVAVGALAALRVAGRRVPEDVAIIGFDDLPLATLMHPPLSTVQVPAGRLGSVAAERLIDLVTGRTLDERRHILPTTLILRESCGPHVGKGASRAETQSPR